MESLNVSDRCGCSPNADQILRMVVCDNPVVAAIERIDQGVASLGVAFNLRPITLATCSSDTVVRAARAVFVAQTFNPAAHKTPAPFAGRVLMHAKLSGHLFAGQAVGT